jgi:hypothetical protein
MEELFSIDYEEYPHSSLSQLNINDLLGDKIKSMKFFNIVLKE